MFDYLDYRGRDRNWLTGEEFSDRYKAEALKWKELPMYQNGVELKKMVAALQDPDVQLIVAKAGTGTGKTVLIPKVALKTQIEERTLNKVWRIAMTIPKSLSTKSAGEYAALTLDTTIGKEVGYIYRDSDREAYNRQKSRLTYMTDGYLLATSQSDPNFSEYSVIIIDEAHERSKNIDFLIHKLRNALRIRKGDLKVIIISATIEPKLFVDYFCPEKRLGKKGKSMSKSKSELMSNDYSEVSNPPSERRKEKKKKILPSSCSRTVIFSPKTSYPIEEVFLPPDARSNIDAVDKALTNSMDTHDVALFFVATSNDAEKGCVEIASACKDGLLNKKCNTLSCATLYSKLSNDDQKRAIGEVMDEKTGITYDPLLQDPYTNKIVFSTNIAESSITIDNLKVVIDSGVEFENTWDPLVHASVLGKSKCTKAQILQRKGRVGRKQPGTVYYQYGKNDYDAREDYPAPNIHKSDLTEDVLKMLKNVRLVKNVLIEFQQFLTPPKTEQILSALNNLVIFGLVKEGKGDDITGDKTDDSSGMTKFSEGKISYIGLLALKLMEMLKVDLWNILILVSGFVLFDKETDAKEINDIILLFSLMEELEQSPSNPLDAFFIIRSKNDIKAIDYKFFTLRKAKYNPNKEHASLITLYQYLFKIRNIGDTHFLNIKTLDSIKMRYENYHSVLMGASFFDSKSFQRLKGNILMKANTSMEWHGNDLLQKINQVNPSKMTHIDKCVLYSRFIHICYPVMKNNRVQKFRTIKTLRSLEGSFAEPKHNLDAVTCLYEKATIMKKIESDGRESFDVKFKFLTTFPNLVLKTIL